MTPYFLSDGPPTSPSDLRSRDERRRNLSRVDLVATDAPRRVDYRELRIIYAQNCPKRKTQRYSLLGEKEKRIRSNRIHTRTCRWAPIFANWSCFGCECNRRWNDACFVSSDEMKEIRRDWVSNGIWCACFVSSWMPSIANDRRETSRRDESLDSSQEESRSMCVRVPRRRYRKVSYVSRSRKRREKERGREKERECVWKRERERGRERKRLN